MLATAGRVEALRVASAPGLTSRREGTPHGKCTLVVGNPHDPPVPTALLAQNASRCSDGTRHAGMPIGEGREVASLPHDPRGVVHLGVDRPFPEAKVGRHRLRCTSRVFHQVLAMKLGMEDEMDQRGGADRGTSRYVADAKRSQ